MRILRLHNRQRRRGGADVVFEREGAGLIARDHLLDDLVVETAEVERRGALHAGTAAIWNRDATRAVRRAVERHRPDVVHVHTPFPVMSPAVIRTASGSGVPVVMTVHSWRLSCVNGLLYRDGATCEDCVGRRLKLPAVMHRCYHDHLLGSAAMAGSLTLHRGIGTFGRVDRYLALTPFMRTQLVAEGIAPGAIDLHPNAAPDPGPPRPARDGTVLFAGRLLEAKGVPTLLAAWDDPDLDARLVVVGDGPLRDAVETVAARDDRVEYHGWVDEATMTELLADAEALVVPSVWYEGLPLVVVEALAAGTPPIVSDVAGLSDLVRPGVDGATFRTGDAVDLRATVRALLADPELPAMRAAARRRYLDAYHPDVALDRLEALYAAVTS